MLLLLGCTDSVSSGAVGGFIGTSDTVGTDTVLPGVLVLAGGGSEGEVGDTESWSARLYGALLRGGDVTGDGQVSVAILSMDEETEWLPEYFVWLGADVATNVYVPDRETADDAANGVYPTVHDAVFIKGGDQGAYYDAWNDTALESGILGGYMAGGGLGGTSAGAMSLAHQALAGGMDLISMDVLTDATSPWLDDDSDGGSGIHDDFLLTESSPLAFTIVDTHFTERARFGRLVGAMARLQDDANIAPIGVGLEAQTGLVIDDTWATVVGDGSVTLVRPGDEPPQRFAGQPLVWTDLTVDRLVDGWSWRHASMALLPADAERLTLTLDTTAPTGPWTADGDLLDHEERFAWVAERTPFATHEGTDVPTLPHGVGIMDAHDEDRRCVNDEAAWATLAAHPGTTAWLVPRSTSLRLSGSAVFVEDNVVLEDDPGAAILLDSSTATHVGLAPGPAPCDGGDGSLHAAGMLGVTAHVLWSDIGGIAWDPAARAVVTVD